MKKKLPWFLLILSICFNVFYMAGHAKARRTLKMLKTPDGRARLMAREIGLDPNQTEACSRLLLRQLTDMNALKDSGAEDIEEFLTLILKPERDKERMKVLLDKLGEMFKKGARIKADCLRDLFAVMTGEQRRALIRLAREKTALLK